MKNKKNLTSGIGIRHALELNLGFGAVTKVARKHGCTKQCISMTIHGKRSNPDVIQVLANEAGCPVYGVAPKGQTV